ncbi:MAG TPA: serine protease [Verrucomicrobiae bacterium]
MIQRFSIKGRTGTGFFITDDGYLISNYHVVKGAAKVRLLTGLRREEVATATQAGAGLIGAAVVKVDAANDLALLKAVGAFKPLPIAASRTVKLGGTGAKSSRSVHFPSLAKGEIASLAGAADDPRTFCSEPNFQRRRREIFVAPNPTTSQAPSERHIPRRFRSYGAWSFSISILQVCRADGAPKCRRWI